MPCFFVSVRGAGLLTFFCFCLLLRSLLVAACAAGYVNLWKDKVEDGCSMGAFHHFQVSVVLIVYFALFFRSYFCGLFAGKTLAYCVFLTRVLGNQPPGGHVFHAWIFRVGVALRGHALC